MTSGAREHHDHPTTDMGADVPPAAPAPERRANQLLGGRYLLIEALASGGMGEVWRAADQKVENRHVAVKFLLPERASSEAAYEQFAREIRSLASLAHAGVVRVLDTAALEDPEPYYVMELVEGEPLDVWMRRRQPALNERAEMMRLLCFATDEVHRTGVLHRDLKPRNVIVRDGRMPVLVDFGLAADVEELSKSGSGPELVGTPSFISPEQVTLPSGELDQRSDVYALGVVLYYLLTERMPHDTKGMTAQEVMDLAKGTRVPRPVGPDIPDDLGAVVMRATEPDRTQRYGGAGEMADDLGRFIERRPVRAWLRGAGGRVPGVAARARYRATKLAGRRPMTLAAVGALALLSVGFAGLWGYQNHRSNELEAQHHAFLSEQNQILSLMNAGRLDEVERLLEEAISGREPGTDQRLVLESMRGQVVLQRVAFEMKVDGPVFGSPVEHAANTPSTERSLVAPWNPITGEVVADLAANGRVDLNPYPVASRDAEPTLRYVLKLLDTGALDQAQRLLAEVPDTEHAGWLYRLASAALTIRAAERDDDRSAMLDAERVLAQLQREAQSSPQIRDRVPELLFNRAMVHQRLGDLDTRDDLLEQAADHPSARQEFRDFVEINFLGDV